MKIKFLLAGFLLFAIRAAAAPFPICIYGVNHPADLPVIKEAGFSCIQSYEKSPEKLVPLAAAAAANGMQVVFYPNKIIGSTYQNIAQDWPILAWYLVDEPDVWKWPRSRVIEASEKARSAFPKHPNTLVIGQGRTATPFYDLPDNLMVDWYPVPHLALTSFGDNVRWAKEGQQNTGAGQKPLWGVVQIFNWKEYKQHRPDNDRIGRFPTEDEIRFMSYDGIVNGASGLFYFIFTSQGVALPQAQPEWWARVTAVIKELAALREVLENGTQVPTPVALSAPFVAKTFQYRKHLYTILLNRSNQAAAIPKPFLKKKYQLISAGQKSAELPPYGVWVLQRKK